MTLLHSVSVLLMHTSEALSSFIQRYWLPRHTVLRPESSLFLFCQYLLWCSLSSRFFFNRSSWQFRRQQVCPSKILFCSYLLPPWGVFSYHRTVREGSDFCSWCGWCILGTDLAWSLRTMVGVFVARKWWLLPVISGKCTGWQMEVGNLHPLLPRTVLALPS